jgi:hypothetical protein
VALFWVLRKGRASNASGDPLAVIPDGAMLILSARLDQLRSSPLGAPLVREGRELPGVGKIADLCGFDPVTKLERIAIAVPEGHTGERRDSDDDDELGVAATGPLDARSIVNCATRIIEQRGGHASTEQRGAFIVIHQADGGHLGQIAIRDGGPVLLGDGPYFRAMLEAAELPPPRPISNARHRALRDHIGADGAVTVTALFSDVARERARAEGVPLSWTRVGAAALSLSLAPRVRVQAELTCDDREACDALAAEIQVWQKRQRPGFLAMMGLSGVIDRLVVTAHDGVVGARAELGMDEAVSMMDRLAAIRSRSPAGPPAANRTPPDEVVRPSPDPPPGPPPPGVRGVPVKGKENHAPVVLPRTQTQSLP